MRDTVKNNGAVRNRNALPGEHFFTVPLRLYESGLAAHLSGSQFKRYLTFLRLANYNYGLTKIKMDLEELENLDGVSARTAFGVHTKLQEFGFIHVDESTKPFTYSVEQPCLWEPPQQLKRRQIHRMDRIRVKTEFPPFSFKEPLKDQRKRGSPLIREKHLSGKSSEP